MINKNPNNVYLTRGELESELIYLVDYRNIISQDERREIVGKWNLVGIHYQGNDYHCPCGGDCNAIAILHYPKWEVRYDCPACALTEIPHLNPIPIDESYQLLIDNPMSCIPYEALRFSVNLELITMEDYTLYALIPFSNHYELNEREKAIIQKVNFAFTTHIEECNSKYEELRRRR